MLKPVKKISLLEKVLQLSSTNPTLARMLSGHMQEVDQAQRKLALAEESLRELINRHNLNKD